jgi:branched-chain amino acid transport system substrate-binding protein
MRSRLAALALLALAPAGALSGCSSAEIGEDATVRVYVSVPLHGESGADGGDVARAARLALRDAGGHAGGLAVKAVVLDDTRGSRWDPGLVGENARRAIEDSAAIAYIGDFESGATRTSLPITNEANLLHVSPASSAVDLTRQFVGAGDDVPEEAQPSGDRTFARVIPSDEAQGEAAGRWARELGARRVAVVSDRSGFGRALAVGFRAGYRRPVGHAGPRAEVTFYAGEPERFSAPMRGAASPCPGRALMVSDALLAPSSLAALSPPDVIAACISPGRDLPGGLLATSAAQDISQLPAVGQDFVDDFRDRYGEAPGRYAAYGYEAMAAILDAIERAGDEGTDREAVIDAFFGIEERKSVLGTYSIDEVGDTTLDRLSGYRVVGGRPVYETALSP